MSNKWEVIELWAISGDAQKIKKREKISGVVEIIPPPIKCSDWAWVLRPVSFLQADKVCGSVDPTRLDPDDPMSQRNAEAEIHARQDRLVCSNAGFKLRHIVGLSKKDAIKAFEAKPGDVLTFKKCGWGETFEYSLRKLA